MESGGVNIFVGVRFGAMKIIEFFTGAVVMT